MSPRGAFILEPRHLDEQRLTAALEAYDNLRDDGVATTRRRIFDTFDWRLHRRGRVLEADEVDGRWRVTLRSTETGEIEAEQMMAEVPRFSHDLAAGPLRQRLDPIVGVRALLARAAVDVRSRRYRRLNGDAKTVSRVSIEEANLDRNGSGDLDLGVRLKIEAVRGYDSVTRRLAHDLMTELNLADRPERLARDALLAAGHRPDASLASGRVELTPSDPADRALARLFEVQLGVILENEPGVIADVDSECLHDLRVATRRTRSILKLADRVFAGYQLEPHRQAFRHLGRETNLLRDLDVYLLDFDDIANHVPDRHRADLDPLRRLLEQERADELDSNEHRRRLDDWSAFLARAGDGASQRSRRDVPSLGAIAAAAVKRSYHRVIKQGRSVHDRSPGTEIHALRKRGKELRYHIESFAGLYDPDDVAKVYQPLKKLQDVLGAFQDGEVQVAAIDRFAQLMDERRTGSPEALLTMGLLRARFEEVHDAARADVRRAFEAFDRPKVAKKIRRLTEGVSPP